MKQRVTILQPPGVSVDPDAVRLRGDSVDFSGVRNVTVERRIIASLTELPDELRRLSLWQNTHELHVRWISPNSLNAPPSPPLVARLPPGLHAFFTPSAHNESFNICPFLRSFFGGDLKCHSTLETFSRPPVISDRFAHAATYQYHSALPDILRFQAALSAAYCYGDNKDAVNDSHVQKPSNSCLQRLAALNFADSIDLDFDAISGSVAIAGVWRTQHPLASVTQASRTWLGSSDSLELGFFASQPADEVEEMKLGGVLAVVGTDEQPTPTVFSFPSRHHPLPNTTPLDFRMSVRHPTGLHPSLEIILPRKHLSQPKAEGFCALHAYLTLPSALFLDQYQLADEASLAEHNLFAVRSLSGAHDLEAPDWVVKTWGSAALLEVALPSDAAVDEKEEFTVTIPTHLRYLQSASHHSEKDDTFTQLPWPVLFWACEAEEGLKMSTNPFDRVNLGYDGLFGPKTMFYHIPPAADGNRSLLETINVPVLNKAWAGAVQYGTLATVLAGFFWICWGLLVTMGILNGRSAGVGSHFKHKRL